MKRAGKTASAVAALMMLAGSAVAADVPQVVTPVAPPPPPAPTFDWGGAYVGVQASYVFDCGLCGGIAGQAGYNFVVGNLVAGIEGGIGVWYDDLFSPIWFTLAGRGGYLVTDNLLVYAELGIWNYFTINTLTTTIGGGVEIAVTNSLSTFVEVKHWIGEVTTTIQAGINWHIGH